MDDLIILVLQVLLLDMQQDHVEALHHGLVLVNLVEVQILLVI